MHVWFERGLECRSCKQRATHVSVGHRTEEQSAIVDDERDLTRPALE
jgi:hypothetical protein